MKVLAYFDPLTQKYPSGVIVKNHNVKFKIRVNLKFIPNVAYLMIKEDGDSDYKYILMTRKGQCFETVFYFQNAGHYFYNFKLEYNDFSKYLSKTFDNFSEIRRDKGDDFFQLVIEKDYTCTNSLQGGIIYQIMIDRFCKIGDVKARNPLVFRNDWGGSITKNTTNPVKINEEVFGGNFEGVISKLDYLKELNVTAIYFNPICLANSHHKYDTADYMKIDDMFGDERTFQKLIFEAKKRNIKIIIDGVYNHTGSDSVYFNKNETFNSIGAYNSKNSKYFDWYTFEDYPTKYSCWWGINTLPSIRHDSIDFQNFIVNSVLEKYMDMGVFGVRLDVVDEISDEFIKKISNKIKSYSKNSAIIGEVWEDASNKISYSKRRKYFSNNELNSVMNYILKDAILDYIKTQNSINLFSVCRNLQNNYPKVVLDNLMNIIGTHDTVRIFSELKNIENQNTDKAKKLYKIAMGILFTLPGVPSIYYGDEYGMENNSGSSRGCFDWENYKNDIFEWIKNLTKIRQISSLKDGEFNILFSGSGKFVFDRFDKKSHIVVLCNLKPTPLKVKLNGNFKSFFTNQLKSDFDLLENEMEILIEQ